MFRARSNHKESRARLKAIEDIEHDRGVSGRRAIVDRKPDFGLGSLERPDHRPPPLAIGCERRVKKKQMGEEDRSERDDEIRADKIKGQAGREEREGQKRTARPL
jgi:hypothetical protein